VRSLGWNDKDVHESFRVSHSVGHMRSRWRVYAQVCWHTKSYVAHSEWPKHIGRPISRWLKTPMVTLISEIHSDTPIIYHCRDDRKPTHRLRELACRLLQVKRRKRFTMIVIIQNNIRKLNSAAENYIGLVELQFGRETWFTIDAERYRWAYRGILIQSHRNIRHCFLDTLWQMSD